MIFFGILIGLIIMGAIAYLAIDKKSTFHTRLAALGALALMILTVIICLVIALTNNTVQVDPSQLIVGAPVEANEDDGNNLIALFFSIIFFLAMFVIIAIIAFREHKKTKPN